MNSKKILIYIAVACVIAISLIAILLVYSSKYDIMNTDSKKITKISAEMYPQTVFGDLEDLSLKGYLTTPDNTGITNSKIQIILQQILINNNQTIEKNLAMGNSTTDQNGCFYFNSWNNDLLKRTMGIISQQSNFVNTLSFKINFVGTDEFSSSSNVTDVIYSSTVPSVMRPAIGLDLANSTSLVQDMYLKHGQSYDLDLLVFRGTGHFSTEEKMLKLDIKGLPCGITGTFDNNMANLTEDYNTTTHLKISVDKNAQMGEYHYFIKANDWMLREAKLFVN